ncbi:aminopeptidase P family protein [Sneathiella glossodoripedis]|uniref:aminopeptidase P family protein n=1 Tax=Sneathiella glossodoripedis TaxID=418853 RepID=UPI00046F2A9C|nr:aminopeptidase P family protein [Sneathiella glossodoripedis]
MSDTIQADINTLRNLLSTETPEIDGDHIINLLKAAAAAPIRSDSDEIFDNILRNRSAAIDKLFKKLRRAFADQIKSTILAPEKSRERLSLLRKELARLKVDGFIIPLNDEFHGEAAPASSERLKWLTGFTGSAGVAAVTADKAAIFVDGRYTIQVQNEVDTELFTARHVSDEPMTEWLKEALDKDSKLAIDPWLHTENNIRNLQQALADPHITLVSISPNPIDNIWSDRPAPPLALVVPHQEKFSGQSSREKRSQIAQSLSKKGIDTVIHTLPDTTAWLLNIRGADLPSTPFALGFAMLHQDETVDLFISEQKISSDLRAHLGNGVRLHEPDEFESHLSGLRGKQVQIDPATTSQWIIDQLNSASATVVRSEDPCMLPKAAKNEVEIQGTRTAHIRDGVAVAKFLHWISENGTSGSVDELSAERKLYQFRSEGEYFKDTSFSTISGSGRNGAIVHYRSTEATNRVLDQNSFYLVDSGGQYLDGTTDITRTIAIGEPSTEMKERFTYVLKGHIALAQVVFPKGTTGSQLDTLARAPLWQLGLDYDHGTGHGVGSYLSVHEGPQRISKMPNSVALQKGMILSNEPGYYKTGEYGIRIENLVTVQEISAPKGAERELLGFETLTFAPIDVNAIEKSLLSPEEVAWLNDYHAEVWLKISPHLEGPVKDWLRDATAPI